MAIHRFILHNGQIRENNAALLSPGQLGLLAGWGVFSTLRVAGGRLFAWGRHWARMTRDARLMNVPLPADSAALEADLMRLAEANSAPDCTLRVAIVRNGGGLWAGSATKYASSGGASDVVALTAALKDWGTSVSLGIEPNARFAANEFCRAKILSWSQNLTWAERASQRGQDEVLLLNEHGRVAECTSANVFAVFGNRVITPALAEGCLPGITREILLEIGGGIAAGHSLTVVEGTLTIEEIYAADEVFITSTTRGLLAVREVDGHGLRMGGDVRTKLAGEFQKFVSHDLASSPASSNEGAVAVS